MIYKIYSNLPTFKNLEFKKGLNILVADKLPGSSELQTRNRAGKSSLIKIIHFLLGADCDNTSIFKNERLINYYFGMEFDLAGQKVAIERTGQDPTKIILKKGETHHWPIPAQEDETGITVLSNNEWKINLGNLIFQTGETKRAKDKPKYGPTFRSLISYFVRREEDGGFITPYEQSKEQKRWDWQIALSFLFGMDWEISRRWQMIRDNETRLKELKKAAGEGLFASILGITKNLRTELIIADEEVKSLREQLQIFKVHKEYHLLESEASQIVIKMNKLADENVILNQLKIELNDSLLSELPPSIDHVKEMYTEAGIILPNNISQRYEDVLIFHNTIIENRKGYIQTELERSMKKIEENNLQIDNLSERQSEIMVILHSHGALDQFYKLQQELTKKEAKLELLKNKYEAAKQLESKSTLLDIERKKLLLLLTQDFQERAENLKRIILSFETFSKALYEDAGSLNIIETNNGPLFEFAIHGQKSKGVKNMQIFCFDMVLTKLVHEKGFGPGFIIHDSHLFDATEERQVAKALKVGTEFVESHNLQYITTFNSDVLNKFSPNLIDVSSNILPTKLTDQKEEGGLFGIRFS